MRSAFYNERAMTRAPAPSRTSRRLVPLFVVLSLASGCAALIYQIVWFQLLPLVIGSSAVSLTPGRDRCSSSDAAPVLPPGHLFPIRASSELSSSKSSR